MKVVARRPPQRLALAGQAEITVLGTDGRIVRLGVCDPASPRPMLHTDRYGSSAASRPERGDYFFYPQGGRRMLVMPRRKGDRIRLDKFEIVVLDIDRQTVRLGVFDTEGGHSAVVVHPPRRNGEGIHGQDDC